MVAGSASLVDGTGVVVGAERQPRQPLDGIGRDPRGRRRRELQTTTRLVPALCQRPGWGPRWWPGESPRPSRLISAWWGGHLLGCGLGACGRTRRRWR